MDRKLIVQLLRSGMQYPPGTHRIWVSRMFEITVRPDRKVQVDEYEGFTEADGAATPRTRRRVSDRQTKGRPANCLEIGDPEGMFHVGRSVLDLKQGRIREEIGSGWA